MVSNLEKAQACLKDVFQGVQVAPPSAEEVKKQQEKEAEDFQKKAAEAGIPLRYQNSTFARLYAKGIPKTLQENAERARQYAVRFDEIRPRGYGITFAGTVGQMKTTLAAAIGLEILRQGRGVYFIPMPCLMDSITTMRRNPDPTELLTFQRRVEHTSLLILDDMGAEYANDWVLNKVDAIITARYNNMMPTIITTNLTPDQMKARYMIRIYDRLRSVNRLLLATGESLRKPVGT